MNLLTKNGVCCLRIRHFIQHASMAESRMDSILSTVTQSRQPDCLGDLVNWPYSVRYFWSINFIRPSHNILPSKILIIMLIINMGWQLWWNNIIVKNNEPLSKALAKVLINVNYSPSSSSLLLLTWSTKASLLQTFWRH